MHTRSPRASLQTVQGRELITSAKAHHHLENKTQIVKLFISQRDQCLQRRHSAEMLQSFLEYNPLNLHRSGDRPLSPTLQLLEGTHDTVIRSRKQETSPSLQLVQEGVASHGYSRCM